MGRPKKSSQSHLLKQLEKIYYTTSDSGSYGGVQRLLRAAREQGLKVNQDLVEKFLRDQASYSLHKPARRNFQRNATVVGGIDAQWQADLADMQGISKYNDGINYLLTVIDVFSKFGWAVPVKNKGSTEMVSAFKTLLKIADPRKPQRLQTDAGLEFLNKDVQKLLKSQGVEHFVSSSDKKAAIAERFNRTLKTRIWTYFTAEQTYRYLDLLQDFVDSYNNSFHRSIGMKPSEVGKSHEDLIWYRLYGSNATSQSRVKQKVSVGDKVRLSKSKGVFEKGYIPNWSAEHFHVKGQKGPSKKRKRPIFTIVDDQGTGIKGQFYEDELQSISDNRYVIEKVLRKRKGKQGESELLVKWKGWPSKFNSWILESRLGDEWH